MGDPRDPFSESRMRETRLFGSMSGNRKQSQAKPDCGNAGESRVMSHRKTNATAPVPDSTRLFAPQTQGVPLRINRTPVYFPFPRSRSFFTINSAYHDGQLSSL